MTRKYSFAYRRNNPIQFKECCGTCVPQRRFQLPSHKEQHDNDKHGIPIPATPHYSLPRSLPGFCLSASSSSLGSITAGELNTFVRKEIEPDTAYNQSCNAVVDRLCRFMQNNFPDQLRPSEIRKAGSLGKGTAVKGKSDADLVVFLASYRTISEVRDNLRDIFDRMKLYLGTYGDCNVDEETTPHAIQVSVSCHGHSHNVDILPIADILKYNSKNAIYAEMEPLSRRERQYYSAALAPLQVDFVSGVPTKVKTLIRLIKYWRKTDFESTSYQRLPSSYLLELIVIGEWQDAGEPQNFNLCKGFYHVLRAIADYRNLKHAWTVNYNSHYVSSDEYYVVDPANPFNNVREACDCWDTVAEKARTFMQKPLFRQCCSIDDWV